MAYENVIIIVVVIAILIFGVKKIPELARTFGKAKGEFEKGRI
ncbi:MAG: twin-arginine translocase TatA/TatE family subunit, partial [Nitrosopumilaceae archaeon]